MAGEASKTHLGPGNGAKYRVGPQGWYTKIESRPVCENRKVSLEEMVNKHIEESSQKNEKFQEWMNEMKECKVLSLSEENGEIKRDKDIGNKFCGVGYLRKNNVAYERIPSQFPKKEPNPGKFLLPCTIGNFDMFALADLGASVNMMSFSIFKKLNLINLKKTTSMVEMADTSRATPKGTVDNILLRVNKFIFPGEFLVIDMIDECNNNLILGRPFLATSHANIKVFEKEITLKNGKERITFNHNGSLKSVNTALEEVCMIKEASNTSVPTNIDIYTNPVLCDAESCENCNTNHFEERVSYSKQAQNRHDKIMGRVMNGRNPILKNHYCNPIIMIYNEKVYSVETGECSKNIPPEEADQHFKINCTDPKKRPKGRDYSFNEWITKRFGTTNIEKKTRLKVFVEWMIDSYSDKSDESEEYDDHFERSFERFKLEFER
ncbi:hypothetical protein CTI12_AA489690 [Artemisia annua]|uniref:Reverse transcriptase domain-containing protein n=1 Tax=Artemisia annua TaxID=35608 RepID=A0A2U1LFV4_ARTAN|nr:hypothetical protein CTI12_AA489690 [Artemisia annua]